MQGRIMVFNDDQDILARYQLLLASAAYSVIAHTLPLMTPDRIAAAAPNLIILDWSSGYDEHCLQLLTLIAADPATTTTPIMVCTDLPPQQMKPYAEALYGQAVEILYKPVDDATLLTTIQAHIAS